NPIPGMIEAVPAYSSLAVFYDVRKVYELYPGNRSAFELVKIEIENILLHPVPVSTTPSQLLRIPVCYDPSCAPDMQIISEKTKLSKTEIIQIHTSTTYRVYMLGFMPGFPYMGELDEKLVLPRKPNPVQVLNGSVGIAGKQTGIYPFDSPGGWHIIGRTPLKLFDASRDTPVIISAGTEIRFYSITEHEYRDNKGGNS
ncbi:MAG: 5-oxoprolinase subunit PxpB, partial [Saprospiraceae bacterium]